MNGKRQSSRYRPRPEAVPQKPALDLAFPDDVEESQTQAPGTDIAQIGPPALDNGTGYETAEETDEGSGLTAPVNIPSRDKLAVNLVPADLVTRFVELQADEGKVAAFFWALVGAVFGIIVNWTTSDNIIITRPSIIVLILLVLVGVLVFLYMRGLTQRSKSKLQEIDFSKRKG